MSWAFSSLDSLSAPCAVECEALVSLLWTSSPHVYDTVSLRLSHYREWHLTATGPLGCDHIRTSHNEMALLENGRWEGVGNRALPS
jgi:hypothetical protein